MTAVPPLPPKPSNAAAAGIVTAVDPSRAHVWVADPEGGPDLPGVLIAWQRRGQDWWAQVAFVVYDGVAPALVTQWVEAGVLRPATG